jgi:hypothetical protein
MIHAKHALVVITISCFATNIFGWGLAPNPQYNNAALNAAHAAINRKAINLSTEAVVQRAGTEDDVAKCFKEEFLEDAPFNAPISEKRKMQRIMGDIRAIHNQKQVDGTTLEVTEFTEDVALDFQDKEKDLQIEMAGLYGTKVALGAGIITGVVVMGVGPKVGKDAGMAIAGLGGCLSLGCGVSLAYVWNKEDKLKTHETKVQTMKNEWEERFKK